MKGDRDARAKEKAEAEKAVADLKEQVLSKSAELDRDSAFALAEKS